MRLVRMVRVEAMCLQSRYSATGESLDAYLYEDEVIQVYAAAAADAQIHSLVAFQRMNVKRAETRRRYPWKGSFEHFRLWNVAKRGYDVAPGEYDLEVEASSANVRSVARIAVNPSGRGVACMRRTLLNNHLFWCAPSR